MAVSSQIAGYIGKVESLCLEASFEAGDDSFSNGENKVWSDKVTCHYCMEQL